MAVAVLEPETDIVEQIEYERERMNLLAEQLGHNHPQVLSCSEHLDKLLLQFYAIAPYGKPAW